MKKVVSFIVSTLLLINIFTISFKHVNCTTYLTSDESINNTGTNPEGEDGGALRG